MLQYIEELQERLEEMEFAGMHREAEYIRKKIERLKAKLKAE
jgi:hypothetical protein